MDSFPPLAAALFLIALTFFLSWRKRRNLPPGPFPLPIVGNILQLGSEPHTTISKLSKTYGPLMSIHIGGLLNVVVSSPEMCKEILKKHGHVFAGRLATEAARVQDHNKVGLAFLPASDPIWRDLRRVCIENIFSRSSMDAGEGLRREKLQQLLDYVRRCSDVGRAVDIHEAAFVTTLNLMSATLFSTQVADFDFQVVHEFRKAIEDVNEIFGTPNLADFIPMLKPFDPQGIKGRAEGYLGKMLGLMEAFFRERMGWRRANPGAPRKNDFLETLVEIVEAKEYNLTTNHLIHLLMGLYLGGTTSTATSLEWAMSELVLNPDKMARLKEELKNVAGEKKLLEESEMARLPYLAAVIKEVLRMHPPGPFLFPRTAERDQEVKGYLIPKGTQILFNVLAIGRDPSIWENPDSFQPERFLDKSIGMKGNDFELIPFGSGRRICPGMPLGDRMLHMTMATLVHNFDWKLEPGTANAEQKSKFTGFALRRAAELRIIPLKPYLVLLINSIQLIKHIFLIKNNIFK